MFTFKKKNNNKVVNLVTGECVLSLANAKRDLGWQLDSSKQVNQTFCAQSERLSLNLVGPQHELELHSP